MKIEDTIQINGMLYPLIRDMTPEEEAQARAMADGPTARTRITAGTFFSVDGLTYKAKTTIPAGDNITQGTNCELVDVSDILNAIKD